MPMPSQSRADAGTIGENLRCLLERVARAAERSGRSPDAVTVVAVSKTWPAEAVQAAVEAGARVFGENRVQEAQEKIPRVSGEVSWHLVGHLQRNKARPAVELFDWIQSVDSLRLARAVGREAAEKKRRVPVLLQVNTSGEEAKSGFGPEEAPEAAGEIGTIEGLEVRGLMTIATLTEDEGEVRRCFRKLAEIGEKIGRGGAPGVAMDHLSMGMTNDFEAAIEEGATIVRIGTAIFGQRTG